VLSGANAPSRRPARDPDGWLEALTGSSCVRHGSGTAIRHAGSVLLTRTIRSISVVAVLLAAVACSSQTTASDEPPDATSPVGTEAPCANAGPATVAYKSLAGVDPNLTSVDIHTKPDFCDAPVVMWVHGGGYASGDKSNQMSNKVELFNDHGWILVSVNYRLTNEDQPGSAQYPDHYQDVADALAWVYANIGDYGGDPDRIALLGHSAGADIVANVATNPSYLGAAELDLRAITCAGPLDTEGFDKTAAGARDPDGEKDQWRLALGNNPDYLTATSATSLIRPGIGIPPMIGVVRGTPQRRQIEAGFLQALQAAGIPARTIDAGGLSHNEVNSQIGHPDDTVMTVPIVDFLTDCFQLSST
jgi:arylformamidase